MKVFKVHRLPVSFVCISVKTQHAVKVVFLFRTQIAYRNVLVGIIADKVPVSSHFRVAAFHHVHAFLVRHRECGDVHHVLQFLQHVIAFFKQLGISERDGSEFLHGEVLVTHHLLETVHIDVRDVAHHQDGLLHLSGVFYKIVHRFQRVIILLSLLVDLDGLLKVLDHIRCGGRGMRHILRGVYDALRNVGRVYDRPLCACPACVKQAQAAL